MKSTKIFGHSIYKTKEIEPVIKNVRELEEKIQSQEQEIHSLNEKVKLLNTLLDMSQHSVNQLNKHR
jgi:cell division protein FtsL